MARIGTRPIRERQPWHNYGQPPHVPQVEISQPPAPEPEFGQVILPAGGGDPSGFGIIGPMSGGGWEMPEHRDPPQFTPEQLKTFKEATRKLESQREVPEWYPKWEMPFYTDRRPEMNMPPEVQEAIMQGRRKYEPQRVRPWENYGEPQVGDGSGFAQWFNNLRSGK